MADAEFVKRVGVVNRDVRNHQIGNQQFLKHVGANVALLDDFAGGAAEPTDRFDRRLNQLSLDAVEIDAILGSKRPDDEDLIHCAATKGPKCLRTFTSRCATARPMADKFSI